jgi:NAD(P)-dependent dehydrogenase (short-subunit alcohol dehydrogenase family)
MFNLENKKIMVTGGNKGIGYSYAEALLSQGAEVIITGRSHEDNLTALSNLKKISKKISCLDFDTNQDDYKELLKHVDFLDTLILNHGILEFDNREEYIDKSIQTNLKSYLLISENYADIIKKNKSRDAGNVVYTSSISGTNGFSLDPVYGMGKSSLINLSRSLAVKYGKYGIRFNCISPGWIETDMYKKLSNLPIGKKVIENVVSRTPLKRVGNVKDLKGIVIFLASDESAFVTGQNFVVDGGFSIS